MVDSPPKLADLLTQEHFLRRLARSLVRDTEGAEDLLQETWLRAILRGPRSTRGIRSWLARVLRSLVRDRQTAERRRRRREREVARPEAVPSVSSLLELEQSRRDLIAALLRLGEEHRQVLLLRYYEDLPPRKIAERLGLGAGVVRMRLHRGLAELRDALQPEGHGVSRGLRALAGMPAWSTHLAVGVFGGVWMKKYVVLGATALLLGLGFTLWMTQGPRGGKTPVGEGAGGMQAELAQNDDPSPDSLARLPLEEDHAPAVDFLGRVLHADGRPAVGLAYTVVPDDFRPRATFYAMGDWVVFDEDGPLTGDEGEFRIPATASDQGYLWLRQSETHYAAFDLRERLSGVELQLTSEGIIETRCLGLLPDQECDVGLYPFCEDRGRHAGEIVAGPPILQPRDPSANGPAMEMVFPVNVEGRGSGTHRLPAVPGFPYQGHAFCREFEDPPILELRLGQTGDFVFERPIPILHVEVLEGDGNLTRMPGRWIVYSEEHFPPSGEFEAGLARVD